MEHKQELDIKNQQTKLEQPISPFIDVFVPISFWTLQHSNYKFGFYLELQDGINNSSQFADNFNFNELATSLNLKLKNQSIELAYTDEKAVDLAKDKQGKFHMLLIANIRVPKNNLDNTLLERNSMMCLKKNSPIIANNIISVRAMQNSEYSLSEYNPHPQLEEYKRPNPDLCWPKGLIINNPFVLLSDSSLQTLDETINTIQDVTIKEKARDLYHALQYDLNFSDNNEFVLSIINQTTLLLKMPGNDIDFNLAIHEYLATANKIEGSPSIAWALVGAAMSALSVALIAVGTLVCVGTLGLGTPIGAAMIAGGSVLTVVSSASFFKLQRTGLSAQMTALADKKRHDNHAMDNDYMDVDVVDTMSDEDDDSTITAPTRSITPVKTKPFATTTSVKI